MNRKLKRLIEDEERTADKIAELQSHLKDVRVARKQEEDLEIVRSIRTMKLGARELFDLLTGIQDGSVSLESLPIPDETEKEDDGTGDVEAGDEETGNMETGNAEAEDAQNENSVANEDAAEEEEDINFIMAQKEAPESEDNHE